jgi:phosphate:Na+ symporter
MRGATSMKLAFTIAGGLGLFLYGMQLMGDGLQKAAGDRLRRLLEILTGVPIMGVLVGTIVTVLVQSSSATTVMVVGFVNAGLMTLKQAAGVILGANIGTTVTAQMVSLKLTDLALPAIALGFALTLVGKSRTSRHVGQIFLGFGVLFLGMLIMSDALKPLRYSPMFQQYMVMFGARPILGLLAGAVLTAVIQSSSAFSGLVITLALQDLIGLQAAISLILGSNIGTCVTALLASIGTSLTARRAALAHIIFKTFGVALFFPFIPQFAALVATTSTSLAHQAANAHTMFNVVSVSIILPFLNHFIRLVHRILPGNDEELSHGPKYLDSHLISTPSVALGQVTKELLHMGELALAMLDDVFASFRTGNLDHLKGAAQKESVINSLEQEVIVYLVKVAQRSLSDEQSNRHRALLNITNDIERIGDHAENIMELVEYKAANNLPFTVEGQREINDMYVKVRWLVSSALDALREDDIDIARDILRKEDEIDVLEKELRSSHMCRLNEGKCNPSSGIVFLDTISNLERIADHANNIAEVVIVS